MYMYICIHIYVYMCRSVDLWVCEYVEEKLLYIKDRYSIAPVPPQLPLAPLPPFQHAHLLYVDIINV